MTAVAGLEAAARFTVRAPAVTGDARHGDSIAVNGVCLTVVDVTDGAFTADVMQETLDRSALTALRPGDRVNLERAATLATRLGGHLVQGHVDGVGVVDAVDDVRVGREVRITLPHDLRPFVAEKGSITVDGVSLTVTGIEDGTFGVALIPFTLEVTSLGDRAPGDRVNLEVDIVARYVARLLEERR